MLGATALGALFVASGAAAGPAGARITVVGYTSDQALRVAVAASGGHVLRNLRAIHAAEVEAPPAALRLLSDLSGIRYAQRPVPRYSLGEPALAPAAVPGGAYEWQYASSHEDGVPAGVAQAAAAVTVAVVDTGADVNAPDLAAKTPTTWSVLHNSTDVTDYQGHGTFVSSLATGSGTNGEGVAGFGGDAKLLAVQAASVDGTITDVDSAEAIVYAVDHGAKIINMSYGGPTPSMTEQNAVAYAAGHGVLLVAAAGNDGGGSNLPMYPAAFLQPLLSNGQGGIGLAVASTDVTGSPSSFSNWGSYISMAAPGENVFGAISANASPSFWPATTLPGSAAGLYGYSSGTSFSSPEVAGAAALVWAADPNLSATDVAAVLKETAAGNGGVWSSRTGYGRLDAAAAVARAQAILGATPAVTLTGTRKGSHVDLSWSAPNASSYAVSVSTDGARPHLLQGATTATTASYDLDPGHTYSFTVSTHDAYGLRLPSAPYVVSLPQASSKLTLKGSPTRGRSRLVVRLWASLTPGDSTTGRGGRTLQLEAFDGSRWKVFGRSVATSSTGLARWSVRFPRGVYVVRARFAGTLDLAAATSNGVSIRVR
jgi:subtilisin family serine protease